MHHFSHDSIAAEVENILKKELPGINRNKALKQILGMIDLTTLSGDDTTERVIKLCNQARSYFSGENGIPNVAAVCVYPVFAQTVHQALKGTDIKTACVAGSFPSGQSPITIRQQEVKYAVDHGAQEIDMVISRGRLIEGDRDFVLDEVRLHKEACGDSHLKVILETGELTSLNMVYEASQLSIESGADFIKTSTGKVNPAATPEAFYIMLLAVKKHFQTTGIMVGIKAAGGIAESEEALVYYVLVKSILGEAWLSPSYFRIGASRLANNIYSDIQKLAK